jgi:hypothetical protein
MSGEFDNSQPADDPKRNKAHIGNYPKGFSRTEEQKRREDELAEAISRDAENAGSFSPDHLAIDNEIAQHFDPTSGDWYISNRQPGRYYVGVKANPIIAAMYRRNGYQPVQGNDPEAIEYKGCDAAGASSLRGLGDVQLWWCPQEIRDRWERRNLEKAIAVGAIDIDEGPEALWADEANDPRSVTRRLGAMAHARHNDPKMQATVFRGSAGQMERLMRGIKNGDIPNFEEHMRRP